MFNTFFVLNFDTSKDTIDSHSPNIKFILVTKEVSKFDKSIEINL